MVWGWGVSWRTVLQEEIMVPITVIMSVLAIPGMDSHEEMSARGKK